MFTSIKSAIDKSNLREIAVKVSPDSIVYTSSAETLVVAKAAKAADVANDVPTILFTENFIKFLPPEITDYNSYYIQANRNFP